MWKGKEKETKVEKDEYYVLIDLGLYPGFGNTKFQEG